MKDVFVDANRLGFSNLSHDLPKGLLVTEQFERANFLVCSSPDAFAVCLEPKSGFRAFELDGVIEAWRGYFVTEVELQADLSSGATSGQRDVRPGDLVIAAGGIFIASRPEQMNHSPRLIKWADAAALGGGTLEGGFSRWRIVRKDNDVIEVLKEVNSET